jgi:hypothetical protein
MMPLIYQLLTPVFSVNLMYLIHWLQNVTKNSFSYPDFFQQTWVQLMMSTGNTFMKDYQDGDVISGQVESQYAG